MKRNSFLNTICVVVMIFCMIGCSQNDAEWSGSTDEQKISTDEPTKGTGIRTADEQRMMNILIENNYLTMENGQYVMNLSEEDAVRLGISKEFYVRVVDERRMMNIIRKSKYVTVENDQYVMNLSEEDAVRLGISKEFYVRAVYELETLNAIIREGLEREKIDSTYSIVFPGRTSPQRN
jgi:hypothetical protein